MVQFLGSRPQDLFFGYAVLNGDYDNAEQAIHGHAFRKIEEVRRAVRAFVDLYNAQWRVEKNGFQSPNQARETWFGTVFQQPDSINDKKTVDRYPFYIPDLHPLIIRETIHGTTEPRFQPRRSGRELQPPMSPGNGKSNL